MKDVDILSFADDNTSYMSDNNTTNQVEDLEDSVRSTYKWFANNQMQVNLIKFYVSLSTNEKVITKVDSI